MSVNRRIKLKTGITLESPTGTVNILPHPSSTANFDWYLPPNAGQANEILHIDSTTGLPAWTDQPVTAGVKFKNVSYGVTLQAPALAGDITVTLPASAGALANSDSVTTFKNKTLTDVSNIVTATALRTATGAVAVNAAAPQAGQVLRATSATSAEWVTPGYAEYYSATAQLVAGVTAVEIKATTSVSTISGLAFDGTATWCAGRAMTVIAACTVEFDAVAANHRLYILRSDGRKFGATMAYSAAETVEFTATAVVPLAATETLKFMYSKNNAAEISLSAGDANRTWITLKEIV